MGIKLNELVESTTLNADDIMHLRTVAGLDKKIAVDNMPAADLAGVGRTTETVKDNADDIVTNAADIVDLEGAGRTTETVKQNADDIAALSGLPAGSILPFGGISAPSGYLLCDGANLLRASYSDLFTAIGTAFGTADGTHFNLPDFRGYFLRGRANGQATDPDRASRTALQPGGNTGDNVGSKQDHQLDSHRHGMGGSVYISGLSSVANRIPYRAWATSLYTDYTGGNESRPINVYVNYIIKY